MKATIRVQFFISYLFLSIVMILLANLYGRKAIQEHLYSEAESTMYESANTIAREYMDDIVTIRSGNDISFNTLEKQFSMVEKISKTRVWLINTSGEILIDSNSSDNQEGQNIYQYDSQFLNNFSNVGQPLGALQGEEMLSIVYPLTYEMNTIAYLVLMEPVQTLQEQTILYFDIMIICFLIFLLILLVVFLFMAYQLRKPLQQMTATVKEYASGHFDVPVKKTFKYDYQQLAGALQYMAQRMKSMNDYQKKFIANVSHDFRSPLTSIKGYTAAMLDGTIPPELQEKYLNIILFETNRLTKLTSNLLELNQFENNKILLEITTFNINNAIKMTAASFEQRCTEKRITFNLTFGRKNLLVDADINKIEQVLQNLVDNAVKFSHQDSTIEISTMERSGKTFVSIKDHGIGIPKDSIQKIWTRFYKTDTSRGRDKTGTGLGLSITKEIIEAHHEHINVISTEGVGTEFIFSLKSHITDEKLS